MSEQPWNEIERVAGDHFVADARGEGEGLSKWFSLAGRISRRTYWLHFLVPIAAVNYAATIVDLAAGWVTALGISPLSMVTTVVLGWPSIVGMVKRLHDLGHSGWILGTVYGGFVIGGILTAIAVPLLGMMGLLVLVPAFLMALAMMWFTIKVMFFRGTHGANEYGPDPLQLIGPPR